MKEKSPVAENRQDIYCPCPGLVEDDRVNCGRAAMHPAETNLWGIPRKKATTYMISGYGVLLRRNTYHIHLQF